MLSVEAVDLYYGASHTLRRVSLMARKGEVTCILGRNGVGKTSLLRAICGLQPIRSGRILWEDRLLNGVPPHERARAGLTLVPQGREIFPRLTVLENLATGFAPLARSVRNIPDEIFALFPVLKEMLNRRGGDLSGGQQQQLAIARALVTRPRLLILDEPTEGIQPNVVHEIGDIILKLNQEEGLTVLLVEQKLPFARRVASEFCILDKGRRVAAGPIGDLTDDVVRAHLSV